jgi:hypothetical protein
MAELKGAAKRIYESMDIGRKYTEYELGTNRQVMKKLFDNKLVKKEIRPTPCFESPGAGYQYWREA